MRSDLNLDLNSRVRFSEYDGTLKVSCGDLYLRFPGPGEADQTVRLGLDTPHPEVNFLMGVTLGDLPMRPRPTNPAEVVAALKGALREFAEGILRAVPPVIDAAWLRKNLPGGTGFECPGYPDGEFWTQAEKLGLIETDPQHGCSGEYAPIYYRISAAGRQVVSGH